MQALRKAAEAGDAASQNNLGFLHYLGRGVTQDYQQAARWFRLAADQNHPDAQYNLGFLYYYGRGVAQDYLQAEDWFEQAGDGYLSTSFGAWQAAPRLGILTTSRRTLPPAYCHLNRSADSVQPGKFAAAAGDTGELTSSHGDTANKAGQTRRLRSAWFWASPSPGLRRGRAALYRAARGGAVPFSPALGDVSALTGHDR